MSKIEITNIRAEFSSKHMCESLLCEIDGTEYREIVLMTPKGFQMPCTRQIEDHHFPGWMSLLDDDFDADTIREIHVLRRQMNSACAGRSTILRTLS